MCACPAGGGTRPEGEGTGGDGVKNVRDSCSASLSTFRSIHLILSLLNYLSNSNKNRVENINTHNI